MSFDVAIVGGGVVGSAIAWRFAQAGLRVGLFDRSLPAARDGAASLVSGGILCAQVEGEGPGPFLDLLLAAEVAHARLAEELGADQIGYRPRGVLRVALDDVQQAALARERDWQRARGLKIDALDPAALRALEPALSPDLLGANLFPNGSQVDSRALLSALIEHGARAGVVRQAGRVEGIQVARRVQGLTVDGTHVPAARVVIAAGAWSSHLKGLGFVADAVVPVRGQMLELAASSPALSRVVFGAGGYLVPRGDRVLVGSTMEQVGFDANVTADAQAELRRRAAHLCPGLTDAAASDAWFGFRPATPDKLPALGPTPIEGLHLAVGFLRNGILLAPLAAELVVRAALGEPSAISRPFAAARLLC